MLQISELAPRRRTGRSVYPVDAWGCTRAKLIKQILGNGKFGGEGAVSGSGVVIRGESCLYYNHERPHQGLGGQMIEPWPQHSEGKVVEIHRIGGLLKSCRRVRVSDDGDYGPIHLSGQAITA